MQSRVGISWHQLASALPRGAQPLLAALQGKGPFQIQKSVHYLIPPLKGITNFIIRRTSLSFIITGLCLVFIQ